MASRCGMSPSTVAEPFIIGTPATAMLSLTATRRPESGPCLPVLMPAVTYQPPSGLASAAGHCQARTGVSAIRSAYSRSTA